MPYLVRMDPNPYPGGPKTYGSGSGPGSGSATLVGDVSGNIEIRTRWAFWHLILQLCLRRGRSSPAKQYQPFLHQKDRSLINDISGTYVLYDYGYLQEVVWYVTDERIHDLLEQNLLMLKEEIFLDINSILSKGKKSSKQVPTIVNLPIKTTKL